MLTYLQQDEGTFMHYLDYVDSTKLQILKLRYLDLGAIEKL